MTVCLHLVWQEQEMSDVLLQSNPWLLQNILVSTIMQKTGRKVVLELQHQAPFSRVFEALQKKMHVSNCPLQNSTQQFFLLLVSLAISTALQTHLCHALLCQHVKSNYGPITIRTLLFLKTYRSPQFTTDIFFHEISCSQWTLHIIGPSSLVDFLPSHLSVHHPTCTTFYSV